MIAEFNAVMARWGTAPSVKIYDSARVDNDGKLLRETYGILIGGPPDSLDDERFTADQRADSKAEFTYTARAVSITASECRKLLAEANAQLIGYVPTIVGRTCFPMRMIDSEEVRADTNATPPMYFGDVTYRLTTQPA